MLLSRLRRKLFGEYAMLGQLQAAPGPAAGAAVLRLLKECVEKGVVSEALLKEHMRDNHVRHDAFEVLERTPPLEQVLPKAA